MVRDSARTNAAAAEQLKERQQGEQEFKNHSIRKFRERLELLPALKGELIRDAVPLRHFSSPCFTWFCQSDHLRHTANVRRPGEERRGDWGGW